MSGPISDALHEMANNLREVADQLSSDAHDILSDDTWANDWLAPDLMEQSTDMRMQAEVFDGLAAGADWLGF